MYGGRPTFVFIFVASADEHENISYGSSSVFLVLLINVTVLNRSSERITHFSLRFTAPLSYCANVAITLIYTQDKRVQKQIFHH